MTSRSVPIGQPASSAKPPLAPPAPVSAAQPPVPGSKMAPAAAGTGSYFAKPTTPVAAGSTMAPGAKPPPPPRPGSTMAPVSGAKPLVPGSQMAPPASAAGRAPTSGMAPAAGSKPATVESVSKQGTAPAKAADDRTAVPALSGMTTISSQNQLAKPGTLADLYNIERTGPGQALTADELQKMREEGKLTHDIDITMNPALYKLKDEKGQEKLILVVDAPPCGCRKVMGKKERCRKHRAMKRDKKKAKKPKKKGPVMVRDDDSDRMKVPALRHAEDSEEEADQPIDGAITPDKVCVVGPAGAGILIAIDVADNPNAGPRAPTTALNMTGILIKGPQDCPQFLLDAKIPKDNRGVPKYTKYTVGTLVRNDKGEHIFFPEGGCKFDANGHPINLQIEGADQKLAVEITQKLHLAGVVDVTDNGMPVFRPVDQENPAPQDKLATVGVLANVNGEGVFVQTKGQTVGSGDNAAVIAVTKEGPQPVGTKLGEAVIRNNKVEVVPPGQANQNEVVGTVVQGGYNQPILIAKKGGALDKEGAVTYEPAKATAMKEGDWKNLAVAQQEQQKAAAPAIEKTNVTIAAAVTGKAPEQIRQEMAEAKANTEGPQEVLSKSIQQGCYDPNRSQFAYKAAKPAGGGGAAGGTGGGGAAGGKTGGTNGNAGANAGGYQYGAGGEVKSMAFSYGGGGNGPRSVFMK